MLHNSTQTNPEGDHYAVGVSGINSHLVLIQIQEDGNQARIPLTTSEAQHLAQLLLQAADKVLNFNG